MKSELIGIKKNILVATQGLPIERISIKLPLIIKKAIDRLGRKDIFITIKRHPGEKNKFPELKKFKHMQVVNGNLYDHLLLADILITVCSTTILEANALDCPYITFGPNIDPTYSQKEYHAKNEKELAKLIDSILSNPPFVKQMIKDQRKIFENQCYKFDGKSSERAAEVIKAQNLK